MDTFQDKVVLVTGAASGIGRAMAEALVKKGARLLLVDLHRRLLHPMVDRFPDQVAAVEADVTDLAAMEQAVATGVERFGGVDIVVANAGIVAYGSVATVDPAWFRRMVEVNLVGAFHTVRAALPQLVERKGYVMLVSSGAAFVAFSGSVGYGASKAGVEQFANGLRFETEHLGIAVGSAHFSWIETPLMDEIQNEVSSWEQTWALLPAPLRRKVSAEECAEKMLRGISRRADRINVPAWVGVAGVFRRMANSRVATMKIRRHMPRLLAQLEADIAALGRSTSARNQLPDDSPDR